VGEIPLAKIVWSPLSGEIPLLGRVDWMAGIIWDVLH